MFSLIVQMSTSTKPMDPFSLACFLRESKEEQVPSSKLICEKLISDEGNQDTTTCLKGSLPPKLKVATDEESTRICSNVEQQTQKQMQNSKQPTPLPHHSQHSLKIPTSKHTQQILLKPPLRERFVHLLPQDHKLPLSFEHSQLLRVHKAIDNTLEYFITHRSFHHLFFQDLRKNLNESIHIQIQITHIQKLLFVSPELYELSWEYNQKYRKYDLLVKMGKVNSFDERQASTRHQLLNFLLAKQAEFLTNRGELKEDLNTWAKGFDPGSVQIPALDLPVHPHASKAQLRELSDERILEVRNQLVRDALKKKKSESEVKSLSSADVANMIFSRKPLADLRQKIYAAVKEKQQQQTEAAAEKERNAEIVSKATLQKVCDEIILLYMSKGVSNIFRVTLLDLLYKKMGMANTEIDHSLKMLLGMECGFLKQVTTSNRTVVVQINKGKTGQAKQAIRLM